MTAFSAADWISAVASVVSALGTVGAFVVGGVILGRELRRDHLADVARVVAWYYDRGVVSRQAASEWYKSANPGIEMKTGLHRLTEAQATFRRGAVIVHNGGTQMAYDVAVDLQLVAGANLIQVVRTQHSGGSCTSNVPGRYQMVAHRAMRPGDSLTIAELMYEPDNIHQARTGATPQIMLRFRDGSGKPWLRTPDFTLTKIKAAPK